MRKIFGGSLVFSLVGAVVLGGVFAWTLSDTESDSAEVGVADFVIQYESNENILGPAGASTFVGTGGAHAWPSEYDIVISDNEDHELRIDTVSSGQGECSIADFSGWIDIQSGEVVLPAGEDNYEDLVFTAHIETLDSASENCMGRTVGYTVEIFAEVGEAPGNVSEDEYLGS